ncbi:MAG: nicotinate (nicotinamide) nucleotide adenylyltransferase [Betaproteobacteria bacterium]
MLGGTFDPVHNAHLAMARAAREHLKLDKIVWMPTGTTRYRSPAVASGEHRVEMLRLALEGDAQAEIDARELSSGASGYTVDTLHELKLENGAQPLYLLMGADQYAKLASWHRPEEVRRLARIAVFERPGFKVVKNDAVPVPMQHSVISASDIRARLARGEDVSGLVPAPVANHIARHGLYR